VAEPFENAICQVCGVPVTRGTAVFCASCWTPHHRVCFEYVGRCSTYACGSERFDLAPPAALLEHSSLVLMEDSAAPPEALRPDPRRAVARSLRERDGGPILFMLRHVLSYPRDRVVLDVAAPRDEVVARLREATEPEGLLHWLFGLGGGPSLPKGEVTDQGFRACATGRHFGFPLHVVGTFEDLPKGTRVTAPLALPAAVFVAASLWLLFVAAWAFHGLTAPGPKESPYAFCVPLAMGLVYHWFVSCCFWAESYLLRRRLEAVVGGPTGATGVPGARP
jgi:hypothetical protein